MEACWSIDPSERPSADDVCHYLDENVHLLSRALETAHRIHPERPDAPTMPPLSCPPVLLLPMSPSPSPISRPTQSPVVSPTSCLPLQHLSFESSDMMRSDRVKVQAAEDRDPFYRQVYRLLVGSCIQVKSTLSYLDLSHCILSIRTTRLRFPWGPSATI